MNEITNHAELTVVKSLEGSYRTKRILMWLFYIGTPVLVFIITALIEELSWTLFRHLVGGITGLGIFFIPIWAFLCPKVIKPFTYIYVDIEEKMDISGGKLTLSKVLGKRKEVEYVSVPVADLEIIHPLRDYKDEAKEYEKKADRIVKCVATMNLNKNPDIYFAYCTRWYDPEVEKAKKKNKLVKIHTEEGEENKVELKEEKVMMYFEGTQKALNICKFLNRKATVVVDVVR